VVGSKQELAELQAALGGDLGGSGSGDGSAVEV
jgi:hypothetical protein